MMKLSVDGVGEGRDRKLERLVKRDNDETISFHKHSRFA